MQTQNLVLSDKCPRKPVPLVDVEIDSITSQCLPNGILAMPGRSVIRIYKDELQQIYDLTRTAEDNRRIDMARKEYDLRFGKYLTEECGGDANRAAETFTESVESVYISQNAGANYPHIKPLLSAKTIGDELPPPAEAEKWMAQAQMTSALGDVIKKLLHDPTILDGLAAALSARNSHQSQGGSKPMKS